MNAPVSGHTTSEANSDLPDYCAACNGYGVVGTGVDEMPTQECRKCHGTGMDHTTSEATESPCYFCRLGWQVYDGTHLHPDNLGWVPCDDPRFDRRARKASKSDEQQSVPYGHAMLPNDNHPGPGCSCRDCLRDHA